MKKHKSIWKWIIGAAVVVVFVFFGFTAEVREGECAVITRFGAVRAEVTEAGLYFKLPWPFEAVTIYDVRNRYTESSYLETLTQDQRNVILQSYAVWQVSDPLKYHTSMAGDNAVAEIYINDLIINASNSILGKYQLTNLVSNDADQLRLSEIETAIFEHVKEHAVDYGVTVKEVNIMKISLPQDNLASVFNQMQQDRQKYIDQITSEGQMRAGVITRNADVTASQIRADGVRQAAEIDAETEQIVAGIYAEAIAENRDLFYFILELNTVLNSVDGNSTIIVRRGDFLKGPFSQELLDKVAEAQAHNAAIGP